MYLTSVFLKSMNEYVPVYHVVNNVSTCNLQVAFVTITAVKANFGCANVTQSCTYTCYPLGRDTIGVENRKSSIHLFP